MRIRNYYCLLKNRITFLGAHSDDHLLNFTLNSSQNVSHCFMLYVPSERFSIKEQSFFHQRADVCDYLQADEEYKAGIYNIIKAL